ncbi:MAG: 1-acyl-sn-glycerol-3-phosphate acyltransferase [Bacteroidota bacterium]
MSKFIEVGKLIEARNPSLMRWVPGFVFRWLERIFHQDDINGFIDRHGHKNEYDFSSALVEEFELDLQVKGMENIPPATEACIFASNHPLGGLDAIAIIHLFRDVRPDIKFIVNDFLLNLKPLAGRFVGVNLVGKNAVDSLQKIDKQFASDSATFIFPAGLVSRKNKGQVEDLEWKKAFVVKSKQYDLPVIPMYIDGNMSNRFYRLAHLRKFLGVKFNFEMLYLVDEMFKQKKRQISIVIGEPMPASTFGSGKSNIAWAQWVKEKVYQLKER